MRHGARSFYNIHRLSWQSPLAALALLGLLLLKPFFPSTARDLAASDHRDAVILIYHRFGEDDVPSTNIRIAQFEEQLSELKAGGYSVLPLAEVLDAFETGRDLPERTVVLTVDDAYLSFAEAAWPRLKAHGFPVTLFVATDPVDQGLARYLDWDGIRRLRDEGVAIGHHGSGHIHMIDEGIDAARADIERANARFETEIGTVPDILAWPYGEFSEALETLARNLGFRAALGQYSGVASVSDARMALPRFPINESYASLSRFRLIANARALPATSVLPADSLLGPDGNPPAYGFTLAAEVPGLSALACYPSHSREATISLLEGGRVEIRVDRPFPKGRGRINCTLPGPDGRWFWRGRFFYVP